MACACKVNQQIEYLQKHYGVNPPQTKQTNISGMVKEKITSMLGMMFLLPLMPLMGLYIPIRRIFTSKPIVITKFLKKKR